MLPLDEQRGSRVANSSRFQKFMKIYNRADVIFEEGSFGTEMYVIHSGKVSLSKGAVGGKVEVASLGCGEFFGEMALVDNEPRSVSAYAEEDDTQLIGLDKDKFLYLVSHQPAFVLTIMHELCLRIRKLHEPAY
jgi:CRP/FNR family transcriptional regulator, cyclic AMP receptor protein